MPYSFQELNPAEVSWLEEQLALAWAVVNGPSRSASGDRTVPSLEQLDEAFRLFVETDPNANEKANTVVLFMGAALGTHLVQSLGFEWVIATDDYGTDLAVVARRGKGDVTIYPDGFVAKRWERRETGFLAGVPAWVAGELAKSEEQWLNGA